MFCARCGREAMDNEAFCIGCGAGLTGRRSAKKTWLSTTAAVLDIVAGGLSILSAIFTAVVIFGQGGVHNVQLVNVTLILLGVMLFGATVAVLAGILLLRKQNLAVAIAGAAGATLTLSPVGIAALVLTIVARKEFHQGVAPQATCN